MMVDSPNLPGWEDYPVRQELNRLIGLPMIVENDANAAAWGEFVYGAGKGKNNIFLVTVGTGIGGALIIEGRLVRGARGFAGEIGHIPLLPREGPFCGCGSRGCLEALASGTAIAREGRALVQTGKMTVLRDMVKGSALQASDVFEAARREDRCALEIIDRAAWYLGQGLAIAVNIFNPDTIIVGGGIARRRDFFAPLRKYFTDDDRPSAKEVTIVPAELD